MGLRHRALTRNSRVELTHPRQRSAQSQPSPRRQQWGVIDCQCHWHPRAYFEAHLDRTEYPRAERNGDGYVFHVSSASAFEIPPTYAELEPQLEELAREG